MLICYLLANRSVLRKTVTFYDIIKGFLAIGSTLISCILLFYKQQQKEYPLTTADPRCLELSGAKKISSK